MGNKLAILILDNREIKFTLQMMIVSKQAAGKAWEIILCP